MNFSGFVGAWLALSITRKEGKNTRKSEPFLAKENGKRNSKKKKARKRNFDQFLRGPEKALQPGRKRSMFLGAPHTAHKLLTPGHRSEEAAPIRYLEEKRCPTPQMTLRSKRNSDLQSANFNRRSRHFTSQLENFNPETCGNLAPQKIAAWTGGTLENFSPAPNFQSWTAI